MKKYAILLLVALALPACSIPYRADLIGHGDVKVSSDLTYFLVDADGDGSVQAVDKSSGSVVWEKQIPAGTHKAWKRSGKRFTEITVDEAKAALGIK